MAKAGYDRASELKAFDDTKTGVKGLVDAGSTKIPRIFVHPHPQPHGPTTASAATSIIPIIDLSNPHRPAVVRQLGAAAEKFGIFQVVEHGVPTNVLDEMLQGVRRFHEERPEVKKEYYSRDSSRKVYFNSNFDLFQAPVANWRDTLFCLMAPEPPSPEEIPLACRTTSLLRVAGANLFVLAARFIALRRGRAVVGGRWKAMTNGEVGSVRSQREDGSLDERVIEGG